MHKSKGSLTRCALTVSAAGTAAVVLGVLSGCSPATESADSEDGPIKVLMINSLTGPVADSASNQRDGLAAAVESVNESGGILGRQVELTVLDDRMDPSTAGNLLQGELDAGVPDLIYHPFISTISLAILPSIQRERVISLSCAQSSDIDDPETFPYAFGVVPSAELESESLIEQIQDAGASKVALITLNDATGQDYVKNLGESLDSIGVKWANESYAATDLDMTSQLSRLEADDPDMMIFQGHAASAGYFFQSRTRLGIDTPTLASSGLANGTDIGAISTPGDWKNLELMTFPIHAPGYQPRTERAAWDDLFARVDSIEGPAVGVTCGWDTLQIYKRAVEQAGTTGSDEVKAALEDLEPIDSADMASLSFVRVEYSPEHHFPILTPAEAYTKTAAGPHVDGVITP